MPSLSRIIMCAAGGGKTTRIVAEAHAEPHIRSALVTYTNNNEHEIRRRLYAHAPVIASHIEVMTWFSFLLREMARPYRNALHGHRIEGILFEKGRSVPYVPQSNTDKHYFAGNRFIYSDKISKFICECDRITSGAVMRRLAQRFDRIFVDEVQDMAGPDLDLLELMLKAGIDVWLVGDHRQATFQTNHAKKNSAASGVNVIKKFKQWDKNGLARLSYETHTHRCNQDIADFGDSFYPTDPKTTSLNSDITGHDGVFIVPMSKISDYLVQFSPQILRLSKTTDCKGHAAMNFGESKGRTFDRVLIFPHVAARSWLKTGKLAHVEKVVTKMYVGATRARYSLAFAYDGTALIPGVKAFD